MRSANRGNANNTWNVNTSGNANNNNATNANRFAPDCANQVHSIFPIRKEVQKIMTQGTEFPSIMDKQYDRDADDGMTASSATNTGENLLETIIGFDALYDSMMKCKKGVLWKDSTASFRLNAIERVTKLSERLMSGTYKAKPTIHFKVTSPKPRDIASVSFTDRVYQRSLNDNAVYPVMCKSFIYDNFACQKGKGTDTCRERLKEFLRKYYRQHGNVGYVAQFDIKGYYPNMDHKMTELTFQKKLNPIVYAMVEKILQEQYDGDKGYNPGSQLIQIAGISVLDGMDHFIKEQLHAKFYIRYMDDFLIIHHDRAYLEDCVTKVSEYLTGLKFTINVEKTKIYPLAESIDFLGFRFSVTDTGKVLMQIRTDNVKRQRKKLRRLVKRSKAGLIPKEKVDESYKAWRNHAEKGNSFHLLQRMDGYYRDLWRANDSDQTKSDSRSDAEKD